MKAISDKSLIREAKKKAKLLLKTMDKETALLVVNETLVPLTYLSTTDHYGFNWYKFYAFVRAELLK